MPRHHSDPESEEENVHHEEEDEDEDENSVDEEENEEENAEDNENGNEEEEEEKSEKAEEEEEKEEDEAEKKSDSEEVEEHEHPYPADTFTPPPAPPHPHHYGGPLDPKPPGALEPPDVGALHLSPEKGADDWWTYSDCSGKKKAVCVGINYVGTKAELRGCWNDAENVKRFLIEGYDFKDDDILVLLDKPGTEENFRPTGKNIILAMKWLVQDAQPNDSLVFHYSGHGGQVPDERGGAGDGDEHDGADETICPVDYIEEGQIVDDMIHDLLVRPLPAGCRLTALFDCCHSGSALDLPYMYSTEGKIKEPYGHVLDQTGGGAMEALKSYLAGDARGALETMKQITLMAEKADKAHEATIKNNTSPADVIMFSGCRDDQTSADTQVQGEATGAMSYAFIASLTKYPQQSYLQLLKTIREELKEKYSQKPQLSACHPIDTDLLFIM